MQPIRQLTENLSKLANENRYLFALSDLRSLLPDLSSSAFKTLLSRAVRQRIFDRICRGIYCYNSTSVPRGLLLFHTAARLRADYFNYISLETVLSELGIISQVPINWISIVSSGCSNIVSCGEFGTIEFIHTSQKPNILLHQLEYDERYHLWRANAQLALRDMRVFRRSMDLVDRSAIDEFLR